MYEDGEEDDDADRNPDDQPPEIELPGRELYGGGKVTIPHREREYYGIGHRDAVDLYVATEDFVFSVPAVPVHNDGAVRIPHRLRRLYSLSDGDVVDIGVHRTGRRYGEGDMGSL